MKSFFSGNQHQKSRIKKTIFGRNFFLGIIILLVSIGCKKSNRHYSVFNNFTFSKEALDYIKFNPGKYFIYKDSATLTTDSVIVTKSLIESVSGTTPVFFGTTFYYTEEVYTLILSKIGSSNTTAWLSGKADSFGGGSIYMTPLDNSGGYLFRDPPDSTITTIVVEGKTYTDVILTYSTFQIIYSYYWAKGVGLIKSSKVDSAGIRKTYTLLRNN